MLEALQKQALKKAAEKHENKSASGLQEQQTIEGPDQAIEESKSVSFADEKVQGDAKSQASKSQRKKARKKSKAG